MHTWSAPGAGRPSVRSSTVRALWNHTARTGHSTSPLEDEQVPHSIGFRAQVVSVHRVRRYRDWYALDHLHAMQLERRALERVICEQADLPQAELTQDQ